MAEHKKRKLDAAGRWLADYYKKERAAKARNIPKVDKIPYGKTPKGEPGIVARAKWLETHREFLRWKKTPEFEKWRKKQFLKQGGTCYYCDEPLRGVRNNIEHIIPKIKGGDNRRSNLVIACWRCNKDKYVTALTHKQKEELKAKNKAKRGTYHKLKEQYKTEDELAMELREMFRED